MQALTESDKFNLEILQNLKTESSRDVWSALANTTDTVLVTYIVERVGIDKTLAIIKTIEENSKSIEENS